MKWQAISVDMKTVSSGGCLPFPWGYIHVLNHDFFFFFFFIKSDFKEIFFGTCNKWPKWQDVPAGIKISSPRGCQPLPRGYKHV